MKLVALNIWSGKLTQELLAFFENYRDTVDIFCLQEVLHGEQGKVGLVEGNVIDIYPQIARLLPDFVGYYAPAQTNDLGLATFVRKTISVDHEDSFFIHRWYDAMEGKNGKTIGKNLQYIQFAHGGSPYTICNIHGLWNGEGKNDSPDRLAQSQKILDFLKTVKGEIILCGDLNLNPDTKSLAMLSVGMTDWIQKTKSTSTRSSWYTKPGKFADYILTSSGVHVEQFRVLPDEVSDHLALLLEFD